MLFSQHAQSHPLCNPNSSVDGLPELTRNRVRVDILRPLPYPVFRNAIQNKNGNALARSTQTRAIICRRREAKEKARGNGQKNDSDHDSKCIEPHSNNDSIGILFPEEPHRSNDNGGDPQLTPKASPIKDSHVIRLNPLSSDSAHSLPPPAASIPDTASDSTRARSTSPVKRPDDLLKLQRPVRWERLNKGDLRAWMKNRNALPLLNKIQASLRKSYIPVQLRQILEDELDTPDDEDLYYEDGLDDGANSYSRRLEHNREHISRRLFLPFVGGGDDDDDNDKSSSARLDSMMQLVALESERRELQDIVTSSNHFIEDPHAEPSWNDAVHHPLLKLAVRHSADVAVENVTRANIARPFIPPASGYVQLPLNGKMIDYALVLRPPGDSGGTAADDDDRDGSLCKRISRFVDQLSPRTFNQSTYSPLCLGGVLPQQGRSPTLKINQSINRKDDESWGGRIAHTHNSVVQ
ncbi:hypothetical protein F5X98DRAFT_385141 [Xylaria grammica]|nr:hypothetical protein F5X98DRAFT_385141 [Xylaria grammica]